MRDDTKTDHASRVLLAAAGILAAVAAGEFLLAVLLASPSDGANIGAGAAMFSALAALVGGSAGALLRSRRLPGGLRTPLTIVGAVPLAVSAQGVLLVAAGILEELGG